MTHKSPLDIHIWSDYVCPFCYLQLPLLARLQEDFEEAVKVTWHAFELRPEPVDTLDPNGEYLRSTWKRAVYPLALERGMQLQLPPVQPRSRLAFQASEFARDRGVFEAFHLSVFKAFFEQGLDIGQPSVLLYLAEALGLPREELAVALGKRHYLPRVLADQAQAERLGLRGVPGGEMRGVGEGLGEGIALNGALPYERLYNAVKARLDS
ncbi:DsbA family protein [Pseudomonas sp. nanlin1]|uniref:DsbA family oxidoreductase n=1 Tax=Pseudomonas sp. nanlin1 TaxID=3040605 RepID=UPI00388DB425